MKFVTLSELDHVAYVKLHRPDVRNAFNPEMISEITNCFLDLDKRTDLRAIVLSGEGKSFCAGADLNWMKEMVAFSFDENVQDSEKLFKMFQAINDCTLPVIGLIHGAAFGGAVGLVACCDQVIVEEGTQFCFSEVKLGIAPAVISSFVLKKVNQGFVRHLMLSAQIFGTHEALQAGLIHSVVPVGQGHVALQTVLHQYKQCGPEAVRETKKLLNSLSLLNSETISSHQKMTTRLIAERRVSVEGQEGLKSFLEKREASWRQ